MGARPTRLALAVDVGVGLNASTEMVPWLPWTTFGIAFAPALVSVGRFIWAGEVPVDRAPLVGAALFAWSVGSARGQGGTGHWDGSLVLLVACLLELVGVAGNSWSIAHLAVPLGVVGLARFLGAPPLGSAALAFFAIPPPYFVTALPSPQLEAGYAAAGSVLAHAVGLPVQASVSTLDGPGGGIDLMAADAGVALAAMLAGIGWFAAVRAGGGIARCALRAFAWALAALPIQACAMAVAAALTGAGAPALGLFVLRDAVWPLTALAGVLIAVRRGAQAAPAPAPSVAIDTGGPNR